MFEDWCALSLDPDQFWHQSPRSFAIILRGRSRGDNERLVSLAHTTAWMSRAKRLHPDPLSYLRKARPVGNDNAALVANLQSLERRGFAVKVERIQTGKGE